MTNFLKILLLNYKLGVKFIKDLIKKELGDFMKIVCSIGPNVENIDDFKKFVEAGMDSMRLNFSHADYNKYKKLISYVKKNEEKITIIQDLQGNKLRVSPLFYTQVKVFSGEKVNFCSERYYKKNEDKIKKMFRHNDRVVVVPISMDGDFSRLKSTRTIFMKDGTMEFELVNKHIKEEFIETVVTRGGVIRGRKGLNAPGMDRNSLGLTRKDIKDIKFGMDNEVDVICLSYTTTAKDIIDLKTHLRNTYADRKKLPKIWAKIECGEAIENFDEILLEVDGIMIGRGDLLSEVPLYDIPRFEDSIITKTVSARKEIVVATYILESMKIGKTPTLPEVETLYALMKKHTSGVMLAGEVGVGKHPVEVIKWTKKFIDKNN